MIDCILTFKFDLNEVHMVWNGIDIKVLLVDVTILEMNVVQF